MRYVFALRARKCDLHSVDWGDALGGRMPNESLKRLALCRTVRTCRFVALSLSRYVGHSRSRVNLRANSVFSSVACRQNML